MLHRVRDGRLVARRERPRRSGERQSAESDRRPRGEESDRTGDEGRGAPATTHEVDREERRRRHHAEQHQLLGGEHGQGQQRSGQGGGEGPCRATVGLEQREARDPGEAGQVVRAEVDRRERAEPDGHRELRGQERRERVAQHQAGGRRQRACTDEQPEERRRPQAQGAIGEGRLARDERRVQHVAGREVMLVEVPVGNLSPAHQPGGVTELELVDGEVAGAGQVVQLREDEPRGQHQQRPRHDAHDALARRPHQDQVDSSSSVMISASRMFWYANRPGQSRARPW